MTAEAKKEALFKAVNTAWNGVFDGWEWLENEESGKPLLLGEDTAENGFAFFLAGCRDAYGGWIWIEYEPEKDLVGIYIKDRPILAKFKDDLKALFEKHAPFGMQVKYERKTTPIIWRKEKVEPKDFLAFFRGFKQAYNENYPLFYMFTVSAKGWYDGFEIASADC